MRAIKFDWGIDFVSKMKYGVGVSAVLTLAAVILMFAKGFTFGIDFAGGTEMQVRFQQPMTAGQVRQAVERQAFQSVNVQSFGEAERNEFLIRVQIEGLNLSKYEDSLRQGIGKAEPARKVQKLRYAGDNAFVTFDGPADPQALVREINALNLPAAKLAAVTRVGKEADNEFQLRFQGAAERIEEALLASFGQGKYEVRRVDSVGSKVGKDLQYSAILAILVSLFGILVYVGFRFDFTFAPGAVLCLFHDVLVTCGLFIFLDKEFDLTTVAALLTLVGFSINDTIVVFDRIRENLPKMGNHTLAQVINDSVNQTLSRTILTSFTVFIISMSLLLFGGEIIHNFAFAMTFGIVIGTYSSVFVAAPLYLVLENHLQRRRLAA